MHVFFFFFKIYMILQLHLISRRLDKIYERTITRVLWITCCSRVFLNSINKAEGKHQAEFKITLPALIESLADDDGLLITPFFFDNEHHHISNVTLHSFVNNSVHSPSFFTSFLFLFSFFKASASMHGMSFAFASSQ